MLLNQSITSNTPKCRQHYYISYEYNHTVVHGEIKTKKALKNKKNLMINFYKLCIIGTNTIDEHNLKTIFMLFQAVSKFKIFKLALRLVLINELMDAKVNFYVMKLKAGKLYTVTKIVSRAILLSAVYENLCVDPTVDVKALQHPSTHKEDVQWIIAVKVYISAIRGVPTLCTFL